MANSDTESFETRVPTAQLRANRQEAIAIIRIGALANAISGLARTSASQDQSMSGLRDRIHHTALLASLAVETSRVLEEEDATVWKLASVGLPPDGFPLLTLKELREMMSRTSVFVTTCAEIRDRHVFHIDKGPARRWISQLPPTTAVILETVEGPAFTQCLFDASAQLVRSSLPSAKANASFIGQLERFSVAIPALVHVLTRGLGKRPGVRLKAQPGSPSPSYSFAVMPIPTDKHPNAVAVQVDLGPETLQPFFVGMPTEQALDVHPQLRYGESATAALPVGRQPTGVYPGWWVMVSDHAAEPGTAKHFLFCERLPSAVIFGQVGGVQYRTILQMSWTPRNMPGIPPVPNVTI